MAIRRVGTLAGGMRYALAALIGFLLVWGAFSGGERRRERTTPAPSAALRPPTLPSVRQLPRASAEPAAPAVPPAASLAPFPSAAPSERPAKRLACPEEMVLVEGSYCPTPLHQCLRWLDDESLPYARCDIYDRNPRCQGERETMRFCIDRFEHPGEDGRPLTNQSYQLAARLCRSEGKRLCREKEWNFACEGEEMLPYPYGYRREAVCNQDRSDLFEHVKGYQVLKNLSIPGDPKSQCVSPFGVINMVGNVDESVQKDSLRRPRFNNALKGGWWMAGRNRCRPSTTAHDDDYRGLQVGVRCCKEATARVQDGITAPAR